MTMARFLTTVLALQCMLASVCWADYTYFKEHQPDKKGTISFRVDGMDIIDWCKRHGRNNKTFFALADRLSFSNGVDGIYLDEKVFEAVFDVTITHERHRMNGKYMPIKSGNQTRYREDVIVTGKGLRIVLPEGEPEATVNGKWTRLAGPASYMNPKNGFFYLPAKWLANQLGGDCSYVNGEYCNLLPSVSQPKGKGTSSGGVIVTRTWPTGIVSSEDTWTYCAFSNARVEGTDHGFTIVFDWQIYNVRNASELDQIFVAADDRALSTVFDGNPGRKPGKRGTARKNISLALTPGKEYAIYIVRTAAKNESAGRNHYQKENGGWKAPIATIIATRQNDASNARIENRIQSASKDQFSLSELKSEIVLQINGKCENPVPYGLKTNLKEFRIIKCASTRAANLGRQSVLVP